MNATELAQNTLTLRERIKAFMRQYDLSRNEMATLLRTSIKTLEGWLDSGRTPPACMLLVMDLLEQSSQARRIAGVHTRKAGAPRGKAFGKGNPHRFK